MAFVYDTIVDPASTNNSYAYMLDFTGFNKRVLEVGCATGYFSKVLNDRGCHVVGIERDPEAAAVAEQWAERVVVGDLDAGTLWQELEGEQFDVITFGDVLEHLRDPLTTLRTAVRLLKPSGTVVISVPNIAHGDVRIALLGGAFQYTEIGLLDRTHLRFFTKATLRDLVRDAGLLLVDTSRVVVPLFATELAVGKDSVSQAMVTQILDDPEAQTYQFVVKAVLDDGSHAVAALAERAEALGDQVHGLSMHQARLHRELEESREAARSAREEAEQCRRQAAQAEEHRRQAEEYRQQAEALLATKTFRLVAPLRRLYGRVTRYTGEPNARTPGG